MKELPLAVTLSRKSGEEKRFLFRKCETEDLEQLMAVQAMVKTQLERADIFATNKYEDYQESFEKDLCLGAFCDGELALCSLMIINRITPRHLGNVLGYDEGQLLRSATYDITFVHPDYRGFGLQMLGIQIKDAVARELGLEEILATISPYNSYSLNNAIEQGFEPVKCCRMYGGVERYIVRKQL